MLALCVCFQNVLGKSVCSAARCSSRRSVVPAHVSRVSGCFTGVNVSATWVYPNTSNVWASYGSKIVPFGAGPLNNVILSLSGTQLIVTAQTSSTWNIASFNGIHLSTSDPTASFVNAVVDPNSTMLPVAGSLVASSTDLFINLAGVAFAQGERTIIDLCGAPVSCTSYSNCNSCTSNGCVFCLDNTACQATVGSCRNFLSNPSFCPAPPACSTFSTCNSCLTQGVNCVFCLTNNACASLSNNSTCSNQIGSPQYCPNKVRVQ